MVHLFAAALHLGCFPRRSSRSQRNNHPRGYLTGNPDLTCERSPNPSSSLAPLYSNFRGKEPQNLTLPINSCLNNESFLSRQNCLPGQGSFRSQSCAVYPLYYGACPRPMEPQLKLVDHPTSKPLRDDRPEIDMSRNFSLCNEDYIMNRIGEPKVAIKPPTNECDLSLRLGFPSMQEDEDGRSNGFQGKINGVDSKHEIFSMYHESKAGLKDESLDVNLMVRKRKAVDQMKDPRHSWEPKFLPTFSYKGTRTTG